MNPLIKYFLIFFIIYIFFMGWSISKSRSENDKERNSLTALMGMTTFVATLFSTFTLMGMPDFFRTHGIGAWLFLGVTDVAMAFIVLWFGLKVREYSQNHGFSSISEVMNLTYGGKKAQFIYLLGVFVFLIPYVAIQLHGISIFINSIWGIPESLISLIVLIAIFSVIQVGGFGAIVRSDAIQWGVVFIVVWIIGINCLSDLGGFHSGVQRINEINSDWLSTPGPKGLFSWEFLVASFIAIVLMPLSQPQLAWRVSNFRDDKDLRLGAVGIGFCSFLVILPTLFIGMYGAVFLSQSTSSEFWKVVLIDNQSPWVGALAMVGLLAAAMSTADSQLHSLRREFIGNKEVDNSHDMNSLLILIVFFIAAYFLSLVASNELILLARISFAGTALVAPMVLIAFISGNESRNSFIPIISGIALLTFLLSNFGILPNKVLGLRIDLLLITSVFFLSFCLHWVDLVINRRKTNEV